MVGVWLIVLVSSSTLYGKVPRLILKTSRLTQAVVFFRRHLLCGALLCNCSLVEREGPSTYICQTGMFSRTLYAQHPVTKNQVSPRFSPTIFYCDANPVLLLAHLCTTVLIGSMQRKPSVRNFSREREGLFGVLGSRCWTVIW